ncbi:hypothetical protein ACFQ08_13915 [Streptosporangium algeriense]|uniref:Uncharacterized protein n=1 Tax=Streptosporangium algeriense TaxID=1682748 RepID=A0ABW3DRA9_9ACTN
MALGPRFPGFDWAFPVSTPTFDLPHAITHYRTPGFTWDARFGMGTYSVTGSDRYEAGRAHREVWNAAVAGPAFAASGNVRTGNELSFSTGSLFFDGVAGRTGTDASLTLAKGGEVVARRAGAHAPALCRAVWRFDLGRRRRSSRAGGTDPPLVTLWEILTKGGVNQ